MNKCKQLTLSEQKAIYSGFCAEVERRGLRFMAEGNIECDPVEQMLRTIQFLLAEFAKDIAPKKTRKKKKT